MTAGSAIPCSATELYSLLEKYTENLHVVYSSQGYKKVLPGLEPGSEDSESSVITSYTTGPLR